LLCAVREFTAQAFLFGFVGEDLPGLLPAAFDVDHVESVAKPREDLLVGVVAKDCGAAEKLSGPGYVFHTREDIVVQWMIGNATLRKTVMR
jgi:hypothetical protein